MSAPDPNPMSRASAQVDNRPDMAMSAPAMSDDAPMNAQKPGARHAHSSSPGSGSNVAVKWRRAFGWGWAIRKPRRSAARRRPR